MSLNFLNKYIRKYWLLPILRSRLEKKEFSLLSNNCNGACILHDLGLQFRSPFVNLWLYPKDFVKYCQNIDHYSSCSLDFIDSNLYNVNYPVAKLDDITIFFQHYHSKFEAEDKWISRTNRLMKKNIVILFTARDGYTYEDLVAINSLNFPKAILINKLYPELQSSVYIRGYDSCEQLGILSDWSPNQFLGRKEYDKFDYVKFFNGIEF